MTWLQNKFCMFTPILAKTLKMPKKVQIILLYVRMMPAAASNIYLIEETLVFLPERPPLTDSGRLLHVQNLQELRNVSF